jgi:DNA-binding XRE family transcriptional regulator
MTPTELRAARRALGLTQTQVADALGVALRTYQTYEQPGGTVPAWLARAAATMVMRLYDAKEEIDRATILRWNLDMRDLCFGRDTLRAVIDAARDADPKGTPESA